MTIHTMGAPSYDLRRIEKLHIDIRNQQNMTSVSKPLCLCLLMVLFSLSGANNSLNEDIGFTILNEPTEPMQVILPLGQLNEPGHQEGSIYTNTTLSAGGSHTCAILENRNTSCWGLGSNGRLGNGDSWTQYSPTTIDPQRFGSQKAVAIASGDAHTCVILDNGLVSCWGGNFEDAAQLGNGGTTHQNTPTPTSSLGTGRTAVAISSGNEHTCVILDNGNVSCWGSGSVGQLGNGDFSDRTTPTPTNSLGLNRSAIAISAGHFHTCVILDNGEVSCWGQDSSGRLGNGGTSTINTPTLTASLGDGRTAVAISSGGSHTCAILDNGNVSCWGSGLRGGLGNGDTASRYIPTLTASLGDGRTAVSISSGSLHTCAVLDNGEISCWGAGDNNNGELGNGGSYQVNSPVSTDSLGADRTAVAISSGKWHTCAILDNAEITCWGYGNNGALGNGGTNDQYSPTLTGQFLSGNDVSIAALSERDLDGNGVLNIFEEKDRDFDGIIDKNDDCPDEWGNSTMSYIGCPDGDGDGYSDSDDDFPTNSEEWRDSDLDGIGDNSDNCPLQFGDSIYPLGCPDDDSDGYSNDVDKFPNDWSEWNDTDNDGVGDNSDEFPNNQNEWNDADGDGVGDNSDAFPNDANETQDSDGDGIGDNGDEFPFIDNFIDSDNDQIIDIEDDFPEDPTQWIDSDGDGYGDNPWGNNSDSFINNSTQWSDADGDGYGDNWGDSEWNATRLFMWPGQFVEGAVLADHCPTEFGNSTVDGFYGCPDDDNDGIANIYDDSSDSEINETILIDTDLDGIIDSEDLCPETAVDAYVDTNGCIVDSDQDGIDDLRDKCPNTISGEIIDTDGCEIIEDSTDDTETIVKTVGFGLVVIAFLTFMQSNLVARILPESLQWIRILRRNFKMSGEEEEELLYLQSLLQAYYKQPDIFSEELYQYKSVLTARYTNNEIKQKTRKKLNYLIEGLQKMSAEELKVVANDDLYFGLAGTVDTKQRSELLAQDLALSDNTDSTDAIAVTENPLPETPLNELVSIEGWDDEKLLEADGNKNR